MSRKKRAAPNGEDAEEVVGRVRVEEEEVNEDDLPPPRSVPPPIDSSGEVSLPEGNAPNLRPYFTRFEHLTQREAQFENWSDLQLATIFASLHSPIARFVPELRGWLAWDGERWRERCAPKVYEAAQTFVAAARNYVLTRERDLPAKAAEAIAKKICTAREVETLIGILDKMPEMRATPEDFDADPWSLNTPSGIVDLRSGEVSAARPEYFCTKITNVSPVDRAEFDRVWKESRFRRFLFEVFEPVGSTETLSELIGFLQRILGYCLSGDVSLHFLLFFTGESGRNGKSTFAELLGFILGDYARKIDNRLFMAKQHDEHRTEIANLKGARLVFSSELPQRGRFDETKLKELTGDAQLSGRFMREDFFTFRRTHKTIILGNHRPSLDGNDPAIAARMKIVPFERDFLNDERVKLDPRLPEKLRDEAAIVLRWLIDGCRALCEEELEMPTSVAVARQTAEYMSENDKVSQWLDERVDWVDQGSSEASVFSDVYHDFQEWQIANGERAWTKRFFGAQLRIVGIEVYRGNVGFRCRRRSDARSIRVRT